MVDALAGDTEHRVAVVEFDSRPRMLQDFTSNPNAIQQAIYSIQPGDGGAAILDSVWYAVDMLRDEPPQNQRVIVLLSETRDSGSVTPMKEVIRKIGQSDVIVYSLAFSPGREDALEFSPPEGDSGSNPAGASDDGDCGAQKEYCRGDSAYDGRSVSSFQQRKTAGSPDRHAGKPGA